MTTVADEPDEIPEEEARPEGVPDLTNPRKQRRAKQQAEQATMRRAEALRTLLSTTQGRELFSWIIHDQCGLYRAVANQAFDPHGLHFREGARAVGQVLHDLALQEARPQYIVLLGENLPNR